MRSLFSEDDSLPAELYEESSPARPEEYPQPETPSPADAFELTAPPDPHHAAFAVEVLRRVERRIRGLGAEPTKTTSMHLPHTTRRRVNDLCVKYHYTQTDLVCALLATALPVFEQPSPEVRELMNEHREMIQARRKAAAARRKTQNEALDDK